MTRVRMTLPWDALQSVNVRTNPAGWGKMRGRQFLTRKYRGAMEAARLLVVGQWRGGEPIPGRIAIEMWFHQPDRRRRDCGNYVKLIEDALTGVVYLDDWQIQRQVWEDCGIDRENPRVEIEVRSA